jgi:hypothetical protein
LRAALPNPLARLAEPGSPLPPGAGRVLADFGGYAYGDVESDYLRFVILTLVVGGVVIGVPLAWAASARLDRLSRPWRLAVVVPVVAGVTIGLTWASFPSAVADTREVCNGHAELCDRNYDEVVYAARPQCDGDQRGPFPRPHPGPVDRPPTRPRSPGYCCSTPCTGPLPSRYRSFSTPFRLICVPLWNR